MTARRRDRHGARTRTARSSSARARSTRRHHGPILTSLLGLPLFPWTPATAWAIGDANAGNFRYLNHFFEVEPGAERRRARRDPRAQPGHPVGEHDRRRLRAARRFYADISVVAARHRTRRRPSCNTALGRAHVSPRSACRCSTARSRPASGAPTRTRSSRASSARRNLPKLFRRRLRHELQRQLLAVQPRAAAGRASTASSATSAPSARCARGRARDGRAAAGRHRRRPGDRFTLPASSRTSSSTTASTPASCGATSWPTSARQSPTMIGSSGPVDVSEACPVLRAWDLHDDLDCRGAILFRRFASLRARRGAGRRHARALHDAVRRRRPACTRRTASTPRTRRSSSRFADAVTRPARRRHPARRAAARLAVRAPRLASGSRSTAARAASACSTRSTSAGPAPARTPATRNVPHGSSFVMAAQFTGDATARSTRARSSPTRSRRTRTRRTSPTRRACSRTRSGWTRRYCEDEIAADPNLEVHGHLRGDGLPAADGRVAAARAARARVRGVHRAEPHARAAAGVPVLRPPRPDVGSADGRHGRRERCSAPSSSAPCASACRSASRERRMTRTS